MKLKLTQDDAEECQHKFGILVDSEDLQEDYGLSQEQANAIYSSIPRRGGVWEVPAWATEAVKGELANHAKVLRAISGDARAGGEMGQSLRIAKQAKKFETFSGQD